MSRRFALAILRCVVCTAMLNVSSRADARSSRADTAAREAEEHDLALECRGALWKLTFDDAAAAGLDPGATPVSFEGSKARKARGDGVLTFTGTEEYRPSYKVPAFPVRYECVVDLSTKKVRSLTYAAVDAGGAPIGKPPVELVRDAILLEACRRELDGRVRSDAVDRGVTTGGNDTEPDAASVVRAAKGKVVELSGRGRARLGRDYEWQPITFGCRWDPKKEEVTRAWYSAEGAWRLGALSPGRQAALDGCRAAVAGAIRDDAARRGYRWPREQLVVELERAGNFEGSGPQQEVRGEGWFKADARHSQSTPITYRCVWDSDREMVVSASFEPKETARTASGEIATGKSGTLICESYGKAQKVCAAGIHGNVRVIRQIGSVPCEAYRNWIYSTSGITVWGGCRAEFEFDAR